MLKKLIKRSGTLMTISDVLRTNKRVSEFPRSWEIERSTRVN